MTELTPTLTQSGHLAVLLQWQRYKAFRRARHCAYRKHLRAAFWNTLTWPSRAFAAPTLVDDSSKPLMGTIPRHT